MLIIYQQIHNNLLGFVHMKQIYCRFVGGKSTVEYSKVDSSPNVADNFHTETDLRCRL